MWLEEHLDHLGSVWRLELEGIHETFGPLDLKAGYGSELCFPDRPWESCSLLLLIFFQFFLVSSVSPSLESKWHIGISVMNSVWGLHVVLPILNAFGFAYISCTM